MDDGSGGSNDCLEITGTVSKVTNFVQITVRLGSLDIGSNFLDILKKLSEVRFSRFSLRNDIFDLDHHVLNIGDAVSNILSFGWA